MDARGRLVVVAAGGVTLTLAVDRLSWAERAEIAVAAVRPGTAGDHLLAAFFTLASGDAASGKAHLAMGEDGAAELREFFRGIGRLQGSTRFGPS